MRGGVPCLVFRHPSSSNQVMPIKLHRICSFSRAELYSALYCSSTRDIPCSLYMQRHTINLNQHETHASGPSPHGRWRRGRRKTHKFFLNQPKCALLRPCALSCSSTSQPSRMNAPRTHSGSRVETWHTPPCPGRAHERTMPTLAVLLSSSQKDGTHRPGKCSPTSRLMIQSAGCSVRPAAHRFAWRTRLPGGP